jgi:ribosomal protein S18 acetylase RimI-like enzyme
MARAYPRNGQVIRTIRGVFGALAPFCRQVSVLSTVIHRMESVTALEPAHLEAASKLLDDEMGGRHQARLGEVNDVLALPGFGAWDAGKLLGVATFQIEGELAELAVLAVASDHRLRGLGTKLIDAVATTTRAEGVRELWLVTTNDNVDALRLYQRRGFRLTTLHAGGVDRARALKPEIPELGDYGIPMHDELVLTLGLVN